MRGKIVVACLIVGMAALFVTASTASALVNDYLCRKVKDLKIPAKFQKQNLGPTFDQLGADNCDLKKLFLLCNPVSVFGKIIPDAALHYCCYKAKCGQKPAVHFQVSDQLGLGTPLTVETKKPFLFCNPCEKIPAP